MSVTFKKQFRKNPRTNNGAGKYYPHLIVWGKSANLDSITADMKEKSSLTEGDIKSVLTNFVSCMRKELYNGHSVNIENFGVFSLAASSEGSDTKEECLPSKIKAVRITFRASNTVRPNLAATRAEDKIDFVDIEKMYEGKEKADEPTGDNTGGSTSGDDDTQLEDPLG
ncbi:MAG: DNA-binding protein [Mediterranea massiliensis]|nr:DNA-binding protein [Mediterranea massiliensis]